MAELVAIATGSAGNLATDLVKTLGSRAWKKIKNPTDLDPHMKKLHLLKSLLEGLLQRIDPSKVRNDSGKHVIEKLQDVKDNLDSLLNMGAYITEQKEIMGRSRFAKVRYLISSPKQLLSPSKFATKYNAVVDDIESIEQHSDLFRSFLKESNQNQGFSIDVVVGPILTEVVIGRDRDRDNIIPLLCDSSNGQESVSVAAIVGIGGQGKTTLAKYVCNDQRVQGRFDVQLWVSCTPESNFTNVVGGILAYANDTKPLSLNCGTAQLHPQFLDARSEFEGKSCLIVFDNIWDQDNLGQAWGRLKDSLGDGGYLRARESKVLITTRSMAVAKIMDAPRPYVLDSLADSDSLILFQRFAKGQDPELEAIGKEIVELCPKVPLVVKNIGCQLKKRRTCDNWLAFKEKLASARAVHMDDEVLETLKVSYNQLMTEKLKDCAAYYSLFPRRTFSMQRMVRYWMALGFVMSEEDGEECMFNLEDRGFLKHKVLYSRFFSTITLHDVMYDLISSVGKPKHQSIGGETKEINKGVCHVSLCDRLPNWDVLLSDFETEQQLQSIVMIDHNNFACRRGRSLSNDIEKIISKFPYLKVLEVRAQGIGNLPRSIGELVHMRHLDLSRNPLHKLPNSFKNLLNLLSLNLSKCENLEELPKDMGKLVKLRHLWMEGCNKLRYMPKGFGNLTELRTLDMFIRGEKRRSSRGSKSKIEAAKLEELGHLNNLKGPLRIVVGEQSKDLVSEAREAHLEKKRQLIQLEIVLEKRAEEDEEFLEALQPCGDQLEVLIIRNYGGKRLPTWITNGQLHQNYPKLEKLHLFSSGVKYPRERFFYLSPLMFAGWLKIIVDNNAGDWIHQWVPGYSRLREQLQMGLVGLEFHTHSTVGLKRRDCNYLALQVNTLRIEKELAPRFSSGGPQQPDVLLKSYFPNLEVLILNVPKLEVIPELFRNFSSLIKLMIKCPKLKGIPDWIHNLSCLKEIDIEDAPKVKALPESIGSLTSLHRLCLLGFSGLESLPHDQISNLPDSCSLEITGCSKALFEKCKEPTASARAVHMDDEVLETLRVSYNQLMTEKLKGCAAYCSLFPTRTFSIQRMVLYWMALGFVMSEEDGEECMFNLEDRGFREVKETYSSFQSTMTLHDVMYDLISSVGKPKHQSIDGETKEINKGVCHVSLGHRLPNWDVLVSDLESEQQLQSIVMRDHNIFRYNRCGRGRFDIEKIISKFPYLKVLEVPAQRIGNLPRSVGELVHMRHLDLSRNPLHKLPKSFKNLLNLLSLDLSECENLEELPKDMGKLVKLRHLWIDGCNKLRYMPKGFENLTELRTLDMFILGEKRNSSRGSKSKIKAAKLEELGHLNNLKGPLRIVVGGQSKDLVSEAREAHLEKKRQLIHLEIVLEKRAEEDEQFLEALQPCGDQLEVLIISNYGGKRLPTWITNGQLHQNFPKLEKLRLFSSGVKCPMKGIFQSMYFWFPAWLKIIVDNNAGDWIHQWVPGYSRLREQLEMGLVELEFKTHSTAGLNRIDCNYLALQVTILTIQKELAPRFSSGGQQQPDVLLKSYFPNLETLNLNVPELEVIPELFRNFSSLLKLKIKCPKLKGIPDWIHNLSCLKEIYIEDAPEMKALPDSIGSLTALCRLSLIGFSGLESLPYDQISNLPESCGLGITGCSKALFEKCKEPTGDYWPHLQHLQYLHISSSEGDRFQRYKH